MAVRWARPAVLLFSLGLGGGLTWACVGDDPSIDPSDLDAAATPDAGGDVAVADAAGEASPDLEPIADGGLISESSFRSASANSFPSGRAKVASGPDGSLVMAYSFESSTTVLGQPLTGPGIDIALVKVNAAGTVVWAKTVGGSANDVAYGLAVDEAGDIYLSGAFGSPSVMFEVNRAKRAMTPGSAAFVAKFRGTDGSALRSTTFDSAFTTGGTCFGVGVRAGRVGVACAVDQSATHFGSQVVTLQVPQGATVGTFVAALDATTLAPIWMDVLAINPAAGSSLFPVGAQVSPSGNVVVAATTSSTQTIGNTNTTPLLAINALGGLTTFVASFGLTGQPVWSRVFGSPTAGQGLQVQDVAVDTAGSVVLAGQLVVSGSIGSTSLMQVGAAVAGADDVYVAKLRGADGVPVAARSIGGNGDEFVVGLATDRWNNVLLTGRHTSIGLSVDGILLPDPAMNGTSTTQAMIAVKLDPALTAKWAFGATTTNVTSLAQGQSIAAAPDGRVAYIGPFRGTLGHGTATPLVSSDGGSEYDQSFVVRSP